MPNVVGIGMTPTYDVDITHNFNGDAALSIANNSSGAIASSRIRLGNGSSVGYVIQYGTAFTTTGVLRQDGMLVFAPGAGGLTLNAASSQPVYVGINSSEVARFTSTGLQVGSAGYAPTAYSSFTGGPGSSNTLMLFNSAGVYMLSTGPANLSMSTGASGTNAAAYMNKDSTTGRSLNAAGTINASGADYAEWERLAEDVAKPRLGDLIGFDSDGFVTDVCADAVSFGLVSTDPSFVGGDRLTAGLKGEALKRAEDRLIRIAYSGKAPINLKSGRPGQYIVARCEGTRIMGWSVARTQMNDADIDNIVGRVRSLLPDGRREIALLH
jgi:hypothetical protein